MSIVRIATCMIVLSVIVSGMMFGQTTEKSSPTVADVSSSIESVGMFKNGLAVISEIVRVEGPGTYRLSRLPEPIHGSWWIESDAEVETLVTREKRLEQANPDGRFNFQEALAGKEVTIYFRGGIGDRLTPLTGVVETYQISGDDKNPVNWNRNYETFAWDRWGHWSSANRSGYPYSQPPAAAGAQPRFLVIQTPQERVYIDNSTIAYISTQRAESDSDTIPMTEVERPVMHFTVKGSVKEQATIRVTYLTKGISWAPSYCITLDTDKRLTIEQNAVIKNELADLNDAEIFLISGYPSVQFGHVLSPLSPATTLASFFESLMRQVAPGSDLTGNVLITQQAASPYAGGTAGGLDIGANPTGEGLDIYYHPIGRRAMREGDSLALITAHGEADYRRIVEWIIPDNRDENGRFIQEYQRRQNPDLYQDAAWDAVCFANPLKFPMTTGSAIIREGREFRGQTMSMWTNPGAETTLRITKALSIETSAVESEEVGERQIVYIGGNDFRVVTVKGELKVKNIRKDETAMQIKRRFSGDLIEAEAEPQTRLLERGVYSVNKRNEIIWNTTLKPGEERVITYRYKVMVDN